MIQADAITAALNKHMEAWSALNGNATQQQFNTEFRRYNDLLDNVAARANAAEERYESARRHFAGKVANQRFQSRLPWWLRSYSFNSMQAGGNAIGGQFYSYTRNLDFDPLVLTDPDVQRGKLGQLANNFNKEQIALRRELINRDDDGASLQALQELRVANGGGSGFGAGRGGGGNLLDGLTGLFVENGKPKIGGILMGLLGLSAASQIWTSGLLEGTGFMGTLLGIIASVGLVVLGAWAGDGIEKSIMGSRQPAAPGGPQRKVDAPVPNPPEEKPIVEPQSSLENTKKAQEAASVVSNVQLPFGDQFVGSGNVPQVQPGQDKKQKPGGSMPPV